MRGTQGSLKNTPVSLNSTQVSLNSSPVSLTVSIYVGGCSCLASLTCFVHASHVFFARSAKSASQRAMRAIVRAMRVTRVMRAMRATVQMLRIFICFIYIRVRKFWTNFFLWFSFFCCCFCYNFGENFAYSKSPKMRQKIKTIRKNLLRFKTSGKKNPRKTYGCTATRIGIY